MFSINWVPKSKVQAVGQKNSFMINYFFSTNHLNNNGWRYVYLLSVFQFTYPVACQRTLDIDGLILPSDQFHHSWVFFLGSNVIINDMHIQVLFCNTENGRSSFVRQLEPDWHIDTNPEIISQLAVCYLRSSLLKRQICNCVHNVLALIYLPIVMHISEIILIRYRDSSNTNFTYLLSDQNGLLRTYSVPQPWNSSLDVFDTEISKKMQI